MLESEDFINNNNPPNDYFIPPNPIFTVVSPDIPRYVLVLDTSGSMNTDVSFQLTAIISIIEIIAFATTFVSRWILG